MSGYELRYSTSSITPANFHLGTLATGLPAPQPAGSRQYYALTGLSAGTVYYIALRSVDDAGNWSAVSNIIQASTGSLVSLDEPASVVSFVRNSPNPTRSAPHFSISLSTESVVEIAVYDVTGRRVRGLMADRLGPGRHALAWDLEDRNGNRVGGGVYFVSARLGDKRFVERVIVSR